MSQRRVDQISVTRRAKTRALFLRSFAVTLLIAGCSTKAHKLTAKRSAELEIVAAVASDIAPTVSRSVVDSDSRRYFSYFGGDLVESQAPELACTPDVEGYVFRLPVGYSTRATVLDGLCRLGDLHLGVSYTGQTAGFRCELILERSATVSKGKRTLSPVILDVACGI
jgi:hypothetical protein